MKKIFIATIISGLVLASCQKQNEDQLISPATITKADASITKSGWQSIDLQGGTANAKGATTYTGSLSAERISDDVVSEGLILVFGKANGLVNTLPFSAAGADWNYDVSGGLIDLSVTAGSPVTAASVSYIILNSAQVASFEKGGYSRNDLLNISYEKARSLFGLE